MTIKDYEILNKCYKDALNKRNEVAVKLAEEYIKGDVTQATLFEYKSARLGVESTLRDLNYCMDLELSSLEDNNG